MKIYAADLFCGAGGFSSGLLQASTEMGLNVDLLAINHWQVAIDTHTANHPGVRHLCQSVEAVNPREVVPSGKLHLLLASPECTHFSTARGGKPMNDQKRSSAWRVLEWADAVAIENIVLENVQEFRNWGPLHPCTCGEEAKALAIDPDTDCSKLKHLAGFNCYRPIEKKKGLYFRNFIRNLKTLGYTVEWRVLNAADYGAATSRERLFILARKGDRKRIHWPEPSHERPAARGRETQLNLGLVAARRTWRPAREIINWDVKGHSIYLNKEEARKLRIIRPLANNTLARIFAGVQKFGRIPFWQPFDAGDIPLDPFLVILRNHADGQSLDEPVPTLCASGNHFGLAQPFLMQLEHTGKGQCGHSHRCFDPANPLPTIAGKGMFGVVDPFLVTVNHQGGERVGNLDDPLPTLLAKGNQALVEGFLVNMKGRSNAASIDSPTPTITAHARHLFVAEPFILPHQHGSDGLNNVRSVDAPLPSITATSSDMFLADPCIVEFYGERAGQAPRCRSIDEPLGTVACSRTHGLVEPFLVRYHGADQSAHSVERPLPTITTHDRLALVHPELVRTGQVEGWVIGYLDILFRMLMVDELRAAMGFHRSYSFAGTQAQQVKQIGNAVDVSQAKALCTSVLSSFLGKRKVDIA